MPPDEVVICYSEAAAAPEGCITVFFFTLSFFHKLEEVRKTNVHESCGADAKSCDCANIVHFCNVWAAHDLLENLIN